MCASQKTLPVCVTVIEFLPTELGSRGIMVIGAILGHFTQILIDAVLASWWAQRGRRSSNSEEKDLTGAYSTHATTPALVPRRLSGQGPRCLFV